jgi:hypothetical protein
MPKKRSKKNQVDVRFHNPELIRILLANKENGTGYEDTVLNLLKKNTDGFNTLLNEKIKDLTLYTQGSIPNPSYTNIIQFMGQIIRFGPVQNSEEKAKEVCEDLEALLKSYLTRWR